MMEHVPVYFVQEPAEITQCGQNWSVKVRSGGRTWVFVSTRSGILMTARHALRSIAHASEADVVKLASTQGH